MKTSTLSQFETFICVAEKASFTDAAAMLSISKAAVSQAIKQLEQTLEVPLFIRTTRRIRLTEEGKLLLVQCQRLKEELDTTRSIIGDFKQNPTGILRISANPYVNQSHFLNLISEYQRRYENVKIEIRTDERMPSFEKDQVDLAYGVNWPAPDDIVAKKIGKTRYVICASPSYLKEHGTPKKLVELANHKYIPHIGRQAITPIVNLNTTQKINLNSRLLINDAALMKECALKNMGIIQLHDYMIKRELEDGSLIEILEDQIQKETTLYVYYQRHRYVQPKVRHFLKLIDEFIETPTID